MVCLQTFEQDVPVQVLDSISFLFCQTFLMFLMCSALKEVSSNNTKAVCMIKDNYARVLR